jgi:hypothetical protein
MAIVELHVVEFFIVPEMRKLFVNCLIFQAEVILALVSLPDQSNVLCAGNAKDVATSLQNVSAFPWLNKSHSTAYREKASLLVEGLQVAMRVHQWYLRIKSCDRFSLLDRCKVLLFSHNHELVGPNCI